MKNIKIKLIIFIVLFSNFLLNAQNFTLTVSPNPVHIGQRFEITYSVDEQAGGFASPAFSGIRILSGPNQSQQMSFVNGRRSVKLSYSYIAIAEREGEFKIPSANINVDGKTISSNSITLEVLPETEAQKRQKEQEKKQEQSLQQQALDILKRAIFVELNVNKRNVYEGEQITAEYKLYINPQINIASVEAGSIPAFEGFWAEEIDLGRISYQNEIKNNETFRAAVIKRVVLTPQKAGQLTVEPYDFDFVARLRVESNNRRRDPFSGFFDDPFFGGNYKDFPYSTTSGSATINVKSLPENAPESFSGAVGKLNSEILFDKLETVTGEPVTLKIKVSGSGNLKLLSAPKIEFPPSFDVYDPKTTDNVRVQSSGMSGNMIFEYLAIPRNPGNYEIGPIEYTYFDKDAEEYITNVSDKFFISVEKGEDDGVSVSGVTKSDVGLIGKDIRYIDTSPNLTKGSSDFFGSITHILINILPFIIFFGFLYYRKKNKALMNNTALLRNKKASKIAKKRLSQASLFLKEQNREKLYEELSRALWGYISDKLTIPHSDLTKDKIKDTLTGLNIDMEIQDKLLTTIDHCEYARYAPGGEADMTQTYNDAEQVIITLEGKLK